MSKFSASDYAGFSAGPYGFYYGYEETVCPNHGKKCPEECEEKQWAFVATIKDEEVFRTSVIGSVDDQFNCDECLLEGIRRFIVMRAEQKDLCYPPPDGVTPNETNTIIVNQ